jgi:hypothetical protein
VVWPIAKDRFDAILAQRVEQGRETYGTELQTHNGRDPHLDAMEELVDAVLYLEQARLEHDDIVTLFRIAHGALCWSAGRLEAALGECPSYITRMLIEIQRRVDGIDATRTCLYQDGKKGIAP